MVEYLDDIDYQHESFGSYYDELPLWSAPFGLKLLERVPMRAGWTYLDVGCGTGFLTLELAQRCRGSQVLAVDPWKAATQRLQSKLARLGLSNVRLLPQAIEDLEVDSESVDIVVSNLGVNNFDNVPEAFSSLHRIMKPAAGLFLTTNVMGHMAEFYQCFREVLVELNQQHRIDLLEQHIRDRGSVETVAERLTSHRFRVVHTETDAFRMVFADGTSLMRHFFVRLAFLPAWKKIVEPSDLKQTFGSLERRLNQLADQRGEIELTVPWAFFHSVKTN